MVRLLVVEDEPDLQSQYLSLSRQSGYAVILAANGFEAIRKMRENDPDIVVIDIDIHDADGLSLMLEMLEIDRTVPVIINSAYSSKMSDFKCWPAKAFIIKTGGLTEIQTAIERAIMN